MFNVLERAPDPECAPQSERARDPSPRIKESAELRERSEPAEGGGGAVAKRAAGARPPFSVMRLEDIGGVGIPPSRREVRIA